MIPARFDYDVAESVDQAIELLAAGGGDAKLLAGGHSLIPAMKLRIARPEKLVDIGRLSDLVYVKDGGLHRTVADRVVMANGAWTSQYVVADLPAAYREAFADFVRAPMLVANVALRRWRFMYDLGITAASYRDVFGY